MTVFQYMGDFFDTFLSGLDHINFIGGISLLVWIEISFFATVMISFVVRFLK